MKVIELRLARLERTGAKPPASYVVRVSSAPMDDEEAVCAAIAEHRRRTGHTGAVMVMPPEMTQDEWLARFGRTAD